MHTSYRKKYTCKTFCSLFCMNWHWYSLSTLPMKQLSLIMASGPYITWGESSTITDPSLGQLSLYWNREATNFNHFFVYIISKYRTFTLYRKCLSSRTYHCLLLSFFCTICYLCFKIFCSPSLLHWTHCSQLTMYVCPLCFICFTHASKLFRLSLLGHSSLRSISCSREIFTSSEPQQWFTILDY